MNDRLPFNPLQAQEVAKAFNEAGVDYLFIDKSAAILLGYAESDAKFGVFLPRGRSAGRGAF